jgi:hypothetical protein
VEYNKTR